MKNLRLILLGITFGFGALFSSCEKEEPLETVEQETNPIVTDTTNNNNDNNTQSGGNIIYIGRKVYFILEDSVATERPSTLYVDNQPNPSGMNGFIIPTYNCNNINNIDSIAVLQLNFIENNKLSFEIAVEINSVSYEFKVSINENTNKVTITECTHNCNIIDPCSNVALQGLGDDLIVKLTYNQ